MTITPEKVHSQISAAAGVLENLADRLPKATANANLRALDPKSWSDKPVPEDAGRRSKGDHSDPTALQAFKAIGHHERVFELFEASLDTLKLCLINLIAFADEWCPNPGVRVRCNGGRTVDDWSDPSCGNWAELTASGNTRGDGLCSACRKRRDRAERARIHSA